MTAGRRPNTGLVRPFTEAAATHSRCAHVPISAARGIELVVIIIISTKECMGIGVLHHLVLPG